MENRWVVVFSMSANDPSEIARDARSNIAGMLDPLERTSIRPPPLLYENIA